MMRETFFLQSESSWELASGYLCISNTKREKHWQKWKAHSHLEHQMSPLCFWARSALSCPWDRLPPVCLTCPGKCLHAGRATSQQSGPGNLRGLPAAAESRTDVHAFLQDPGLARGGSLSVWPGLCLQFIYSAAYAGSAHKGSSNPLYSLWSPLHSPKLPFAAISPLWFIREAAVMFSIFLTLESNGLTLPASYHLPWVR